MPGYKPVLSQVSLTLISVKLKRLRFTVLGNFWSSYHTAYILIILHVSILGRYYTRFFGRIVNFFLALWSKIRPSDFLFIWPSGFGLLDQFVFTFHKLSPTIVKVSTNLATLCVHLPHKENASYRTAAFSQHRYQQTTSLLK